MTQRVLATLIVLAFGLGLVAGPHPCGPRHGEKGRSEASCHGKGPEMTVAGMDMDGHAAPGRAGLPARGHDPADCCDTFCRHVCHMPAIAAARPVAFAIEPAALTVVEPSDPGLPLFAQLLDHVPLA